MHKLISFSKYYFILILLLFTSFVFSQKSTIRGYVQDSDNGEPILYALVVIDGTELSALTDANGFYSISDVPAGKLFISTSYTGYDDAKFEITIGSNEVLNKTLYLKAAPISINEVVVSAQKDRAKTEIQISKITVTPKQIKSLPSVGGEADIAQYLQVLPGIVSTGDQGGQIFIRGGSPVQNKILLDGLNIYNPFHSLGFFSVFETELIRNVEVLTGGFNAEYGGRVSAIVDIKTREGNKSKLSGYGSVSPFIGKFLLETPISKFEQGKGSTSIVVTGKKSLIDQTSKSLYSYATDNDSVGLPFSFTDLYAKLSMISANGSKLNFFGFNFKDEYNNPAVAKIGWGNIGIGTDFSIIPNNSDIIVRGTIGYTKYDLGIRETIDKRQSSIGEFGATVDFSVFKNKSEIKYGFDLRAITTDFQFVNPYKVLLNQIQNTTEFSTFVKYKRNIGRLTIEPSIRLMYYASQTVFSPEPRLGLKYNITDNVRIKAAGGLYSQNVMSTSNERDVVNLFYGFLTSPEVQIKGLDGQNISNKLQLAQHAVGGIEIDVNEKLKLNLESYFKNFSQILVVNRNKTSVTEPDYVVETGKAYGADASIKYEAKKFNILTTYTYGFVNRFDGEQTYPTVFDRRHNVNFLTTYNFDEKGDFSASFRWNLGSGFPFTKTQGFYNQLAFVNGPNTNYQVENSEQLGIIYSQIRNGGRLPYYHRLDASVTKKFTFSKYTYMELTGSVTNAYDRENIFYFDRVKYTRANQLPIIPAIAMKVGF